MADPTRYGLARETLVLFLAGLAWHALAAMLPGAETAWPMASRVTLLVPLHDPCVARLEPGFELPLVAALGIGRLLTRLRRGAATRSALALATASVASTHLLLVATVLAPVSDVFALLVMQPVGFHSYASHQATLAGLAIAALTALCALRALRGGRHRRAGPGAAAGTARARPRAGRRGVGRA
jgi:hypothetical protein